MKNQRYNPKPGGAPAICPAETFKLMIQRERARADRGHGLFSLILFDANARQDPASNRQLIHALTHRVRITDCLGVLADASVGVLLADAPHSGGESFLKNIEASLPEEQALPEYQLYTYPADSAHPGDNQFITAVGTDVTRTEKVLNNLLAQHHSAGRVLLESIGAGIAVICLSPLMLLIAIAIKCSSPGPVLFSQMRIGHKGTLFRCYKFRSMHPNIKTDVHEDYFENLMTLDMPMQKLDNLGDPRIFPVGKLLRASSMDELPQLFNIIRGEMSLIGPRPSTPHEYRNYRPWHRHRVDTLPGLTGLWQVNGKNKTTFKEMMRFDMRYAQQQSVWMDLSIIGRTLPVIIEQYQESRRTRKAGHPTRTRHNRLRIPTIQSQERK